MAYTTTMERANKPRSGIALGGIGAGWFELRQDGLTYDWNIFNNRPLGRGPALPFDNGSMLFFVVRYQIEGQEPQMKLLQIENKYNAAAIEGHEMYYMFPWLSGVDKIEYSGTFPFITIKFFDKEMPFDIVCEAFSPFIPGDTKNSSLPLAGFTFTITPKSSKPVDVMIMASLRNSSSYDLHDRTYYSSVVTGKNVTSIEMGCETTDINHISYGTMGLSSLSSKASWYLGWEHHHPYYEIVLRNKTLPNINDTDGRNQIDKKTKKKHAMERCFSTIAESSLLKKGSGPFQSTFMVTWCFPNNYAWEHENDGYTSRNEGHYYSNFFESSTDVAKYAAKNFESLYTQTVAFKNAFFDSSAPVWLLDQINSHFNTYFTSSWLTKEGNFGIIEGLNSKTTFAGLSTIDVATYGSVSYALLFPDLAKKSIEAYASFQNDNGSVAHSIHYNFETLDPKENTAHRLDLPGHFAFIALRNFFWTGDRNYLNNIWPNVKKALDYILNERDKNSDGLPDMEGIMCSYDNFPMYGISSYVAGTYLAAVALALEAAELLEDHEAIIKYGDIFNAGLIRFEEQMWNGKYYRLYNDQGGEQGGTDEGCLADQLLGQWEMHQVGKGAQFLHKTRVRKALKSILTMNFKKNQGLRNCQWPNDTFFHDINKDTWIDQANTCWTGVEFSFAALLLYEGLTTEAFTVLKNIDDRYRKWGMYWDHQEFGGRYFRPMSSFNIVNALLGLSISNSHYSFAPVLKEKSFHLFFPFANGYGHYLQSTGPKSEKFTIAISKGTFSAEKLTVTSSIEEPKHVTVMVNSKVLPESSYLVTFSNTLSIEFTRAISVAAGKQIVLSVQ